MATYTKFLDFTEQFAKGVHDFDTHTFKLMLTNSAPVNTNTVKADLTEISAGNGYTAGGTALSSVTVSETSGTTTFDAADVTFTASGGAMATFRYVVLYNDTATSPADALIAWWDNGSSVSLASGESFTVQFNASGIFTLA